MTASAPSALPCSCPECSQLRFYVGARASRGKIPDALVHDDGSPVVLTLNEDITLTAAEAHLRLALDNGKGDPDEIRRAIGKLKASPPALNGFGDYGSALADAVKVVNRIRAAATTTKARPR